MAKQLAALTRLIAIFLAGSVIRICGPSLVDLWLISQLHLQLMFTRATGNALWLLPSLCQPQWQLLLI